MTMKKWTQTDSTYMIVMNIFKSWNVW